MDDVLLKKAAELLLKGATLTAQPCPYCRGVRVIKDGGTLCINCGAESEKRQTDNLNADYPHRLEKKLDELSRKLEQETDYGAQQEIIKSISLLSKTISDIKAGNSADDHAM